MPIFVSAKYVDEAQTRVEAVDENGGFWTMSVDSTLPEWPSYIENGGTIDPYVAPPPPELPRPTLLEIQPQSLELGEEPLAPFTITCLGGDFEELSRIYFNGVALPDTAFVDRQHLTGTVPAIDIAGDYPVSVITDNRRTIEIMLIVTNLLPPLTEPPPDVDPGRLIKKRAGR